MIAHTFVARASVAGAIVIALSLTGCAAEQSDYDGAAAERLQSQILEISNASSQADFATALASLDVLDVQLKDALAKGEITQARYDSISAASALVRADLQAAIEALTPPPAVTNPGNGDGDDDDDNNKGKGNGKDGDKD